MRDDLEQVDTDAGAETPAGRAHRIQGLGARLQILFRLEEREHDHLARRTAVSTRAVYAGVTSSIANQTGFPKACAVAIM